jgi:hypothetical protein
MIYTLDIIHKFSNLKEFGHHLNPNVFNEIFKTKADLARSFAWRNASRIVAITT